MRHADGDRGDTMLGESLGEGDAFAIEVVRADEVDAESRQVARCGGAIDVEIGDARAEQPSRQLVLDDGARANRRLVHDQVVRRDAE
jgi:hypothetical protein